MPWLSKDEEYIWFPIGKGERPSNPDPRHDVEVSQELFDEMKRVWVRYTKLLDRVSREY